MKKSSQRTLSRLLAGIMIFSSLCTNMVYADDAVVIAENEAVASESAVEVVQADSAEVQTYAIEYPATPVEGEDYVFNFADGVSIVPSDTDGKSDIDKGIVRVKVGTQNAYGYNGTQHGSVFKAGNTIEIDVAGPGTVAIEGCNYNKGVNVTLSGDGYSETMNVLGVNRQDAEGNPGSSKCGEMMTFPVYKGGAGTLTLSFDASEVYIPQITFTHADAAALAELTPAVAGETYKADFESMDAAPYDNVLFADGHIKAHGTGGTRGVESKHGVDVKPNDYYELAVAGPANIYVLSCTYSSKDGTFTLYDEAGNVVDSANALPDENVNADGTEKPLALRYSGEAGTLKLVYTTTSGQAYMHYLTIENDAASIGEAVDFEEWFDDVVTVAEDGTRSFAPQTFKYGDSTVDMIAAAGNDFVIANENFKDLEREGKIVNAYKAGNRPQNAETGAHCNNMTSIPVQGDGNCMVFTPAARGMFTVWVRAWDGKEARVWKFKNGEVQGYDSYNTGDTAVEQISFVAEAGYQYVICTTGQTNNFAFCGVRYLVDEEITVPVVEWTTPGDSSYNFDTASFELYDYYLGTKVADIKKNTTSVKVLNNHKYYIWSLDPGAGATFAETATGEVVLSKDTANVQLVLEEIPDTTLTGTFITSDGGEPDVTEVTFKNTISGGVYTATISEDGKSYTCTLKPGDYSTSVTAGSYNAKDNAHVEGDGSSVNDIFLKELESSLYDLPTEISNKVSRLQFIPAEGGTMKYNNSTSISASDGGKIVVPVDGVKKVIVTGWYDGTWDINGQGEVSANKDDNGNYQKCAVAEYITDGTETEVTINIKESPTYLYELKVIDVDDYKWDPENTVLQVPTDKFPTLKSANDYIKNIADRPEGEDGRMTIELLDDMEEQIVFDQPYVTLKGNGHEISWYYGVGTYYYSIDKATGLYDEFLFYDKYASQEGNGSLWGGVAIIRGDYFLAEDTIFRNNYNYKATEKYAADVASSAFVIDKATGELRSDLGIYSAKERSNAFYIEAKNIEVFNCQILSSQDTFGRNGSADGGYSVYLKNTVIGGNVDYICGEFTAVFDNCNLQWKTYTDESTTNNNKIGYITAAKTNPYIFRNCEVTADNENIVSLGYYGRTWGPGSNVTFYNTETNGHIGVMEGGAPYGWGAMNSGDADPTFYEYQNKKYGSDFELINSTASNVHPAVLPEDLVASYTTDMIIENVLGGWTPVHYDAAGATWWKGTPGDVDKDGEITANDASIAYQIALISTFGDGDPNIDKRAADVDGVAGITAADAAWILQKALISTTLFPVEEESEDPVDPVDPTDPTTGAEIKVYVVGDSTACHYGESDDVNYWFRRVGFGDALQQYLDETKVEVINLGLSGRSSKSYYTGVNENGKVDDAAVTFYKQLHDNIKKDDILIIAWGHNDEKADQYRYTNANGSITDEGSFKKSLYDNYIKVAQDAGASVILCTPIIRRNAGTVLSDNDVHKPAGTAVYPGGDYGQCIRDLGAELKIPVVDSLANTQALWTELKAGAQASETAEPTGYAALHAATQEWSVDNTHLNKYGADYVAYMMARDIKNLDTPLAQYVKADIAAPTFVNEEVKNPTWTAFDESVYVPSSIWKVEEPWAGSVFGSSVGDFTEDNHPNCDIVGNGSASSVTLISANNKGKIASSEDGLVMYFQEIGASQNFTLTATAHINSFDATNNQGAFGLMVRDNMFSDHQYKTRAHYIAVGDTAQNSGAELVRVWRRKTITEEGADTTKNLVKEVISETPAAVDTFAAGTDVKLSLSRKDGVYTLKFNDEIYTGAYEGTDLTLVNADKDYVGVFVSRTADVTFNDISLTLE